VLGGIEAADIELDQLRSGAAKDRARSGREIRQPRAHGQHDIGLRRQGVGRRRSRHAQGAGVRRMRPGERAFARLGFGARNAPLAEAALAKFAGERVFRPAADQDHRLARAPQRVGRARKLGFVGCGAADAMHALGQEFGRAVEGFGLHVLRQAQNGRPAFGRVEQHA
jgi:hypothetical protein